MKRIVSATEIIKENEQEVIFLPESMIEEIDKVIKENNDYNDREEFVIAAVEKFIKAAIQEKITSYPRSKFWLKEI